MKAKDFDNLAREMALRYLNECYSEGIPLEDIEIDQQAIFDASRDFLEELVDTAVGILDNILLQEED